MAKKKHKHTHTPIFYTFQVVLILTLLYTIFPWTPSVEAAANPVIVLSTERQCNLDVATKKLNTSLEESDKLNPCVTVVAPATPVVPTVKKVTVVQVKEDVPTAVAMGQQMAAARGWAGAEWDALYQLWMRESGWNPRSANRSSGACGIPQAYPCSKITDKTTAGQITWGLNYIQRRYGSPSAAWNYWLNHHSY